MNEEDNKGIFFNLNEEKTDEINNEDDNEVKIIYKIQSLSFVSKLISNIYIFYFFIFVPIGILIYKQIRRLIKEDDDEEEEK